MIREGTCTTVALYHLDNEVIDIRGLFNFCEKWMLNLGYMPKRGSADGEKINATKTWTFKYAKQFLEKREFKKITGFWFSAYSTDEWDSDMLDPILSVELDTDNSGLFVLYFHNQIIPFKKEYVERLICELMKDSKANYGIVFQRDFSKGPGLYAAGIATGLDDRIKEQREEEEKTAKWWREYTFSDSKYKLGQLRDIYPMNLLSEAHLKESVFGKTLQEWIESSPKHGELKPLTDILWEWWIPEEKIASVREALLPTGLVICI